MAKSFMPTIKTEKELKDLQLNGLEWTVNHAYQGSDFYRKRFDETNVKPDDIHSLDDIKRLPFTTAQDLQDGYPFPNLSDDIVFNCDRSFLHPLNHHPHDKVRKS